MSTKGKEKATRGKAWGDEEVLVLARSWLTVSKLPTPPGETSKMSAERVYCQFLEDIYELAKDAWHAEGSPERPFDAFKGKGGKTGPEGGIDFCDENYQPRKERPVADKMAAMKGTYTLIKDHDRGSLVGSTGQMEWFSRPETERTALLRKNNKVAISKACFDVLEQIHEDDPSINPIDTGVSFGSASIDRGQSPSSSSLFGVDSSPEPLPIPSV